MFPINFNFPYRKKDGSLITMEKALDGAGADLDLIDLDDVAITTPTNGDLLIYDGTAEKWKNDNIDIKDIDDVALTDLADGDGLLYDATAEKWKNMPIEAAVEKVNELYGLTNNKISYIRGYYAYDATLSNILTLIQNFLTAISITNDIGVIDAVIAGNTPWSVRGYCFSTKDFAVLTAMRYDGSCKLFYRSSGTDTIKDFTTTT